MSTADPDIKLIADTVAACYRLPAHDLAVRMLDEFVEDHSLEDLPAVWHHLARIIADVYTTAGLEVLPPDSPPPPSEDRYALYDYHAHQLTVLCQKHPVDAGPAVDEYARTIGHDPDLWKGIVLCMSNLVAEGTNAHD